MPELEIKITWENMKEFNEIVNQIQALLLSKNKVQVDTEYSTTMSDGTNSCEIFCTLLP